MGIFFHVDLCFFLALSSYSFPLSSSFSSLFPLVESYSCLASINEEGKYWEREGEEVYVHRCQWLSRQRKTTGPKRPIWRREIFRIFWHFAVGGKVKGGSPFESWRTWPVLRKRIEKCRCCSWECCVFFAWKASSFSTLVDRHTCVHYVSGRDFQFRWKAVVDKQSGISETLTFCIWKMNGSLCILSEELWRTIWFWQCGTICYLKWL